MSLPARVLLAALVLATASLTIASLALVDVIPAWGILFFYVVPTIFFGVWLLGAFAPPAWRRTVTPLRRAFRLSRLASGRPAGGASRRRGRSASGRSPTCSPSRRAPG